MINSVSSFHKTNKRDLEYLKIIEHATKAPSGHNTQPWKFVLNKKSIEIHPDLDRALHHVDSDYRELYISLGCAAENLSIAASEYGYSASFSIRKVSKEYSWIHINLIESETQKNKLFKQIDIRQTNRSVYTSKIIDENIIRKVNQTENNYGIKVRFFPNGTKNFAILKDSVVEANKVQMRDKAFKCELLDWIRYDDKQIESKKDGLTYKVVGMPACPHILGRMIVKAYLKPKKQNVTDVEKIHSSSHLVLFTAENNDSETWIKLGRIHQRLLLHASKNNIAVAYLNQPCEVERISIILQNKMNLNPENIMLLLRIGYADKLPYSPRRKIEEIIETGI